jgi:hypothetical protein
MQSRIFHFSSRLLLLSALLVQIAFGAGTIAYCISTEEDSRIHVCSSPALCEEESQLACAAATEDQVQTTCCAASAEETEFSGCSEESVEECAKHFCSTTHSCNLVPSHLTSERLTELQISLSDVSFLWNAGHVASPSVSLRVIRGDNSPPRQIAELATLVPRRGPPILS